MATDIANAQEVSVSRWVRKSEENLRRTYDYVKAKFPVYIGRELTIELMINQSNEIIWSEAVT
jgi:hypothetical protein